MDRRRARLLGTCCSVWALRSWRASSSRRRTRSPDARLRVWIDGSPRPSPWRGCRRGSRRRRGAARRRGASGRRIGGAGRATTLTLGERQLWLARAELALASQQPRARWRRRRDSPEHRQPQQRARRRGDVRRRGVARAERFDGRPSPSTPHAKRRRVGARPLLWRTGGSGQVHRARRQRLEARQAFDRASAIAELAQKIEDEAASGIPQRRGGCPACARLHRRRASPRRRPTASRRERDVAARCARQGGQGDLHDSASASAPSRATSRARSLKLGFDSRARLAAWAKGSPSPRTPYRRRRGLNFPARRKLRVVSRCARLARYPARVRRRAVRLGERSQIPETVPCVAITPSSSRRPRDCCRLLLGEGRRAERCSSHAAGVKWSPAPPVRARCADRRHAG